MTITTRTGKGSALTHPEMDANLNTFNNWTSGPATKTAAKALTPEDGVKIYPQGTDGGVFIGVTGSPTTLTDNGGTAYGTEFIPSGGDGSAGWRRYFPDKIVLTPAMFGAVGDYSAGSGTDNIAALDNLFSARQDGMVIEGDKSKTYGINSVWNARDVTISASINNLNIAVLSTGTGLNFSIRFSFLNLVVTNSTFEGIVDDTGYVVLVDNVTASVLGDYIFENSKMFNGRLAGLQAEAVKSVLVHKNCIIENISQFHGIATRRGDISGIAVEKLLVKDSVIKQCRSYCVDGHAIDSRVENCDIINCAYGYKNQLSYLENNPTTGTTPIDNVTRETQAVFSNNNFYIDYDDFNYHSTMIAAGLISPEICFSTSEYTRWEGNNINVYNCISGVSYNLYTDGARVKGIARDNYYNYDSSAQIHGPVLSIGEVGRYEYINETYNIEQLNHAFILSDGPAREILIDGLDLTLGSGIGAATRRIIGDLCEAEDVKVVNSTITNNEATQLCYPIYIPGTDVITNLHFSNNTIKGTIRNVIEIVGTMQTVVNIEGNIGFRNIPFPNATDAVLNDVADVINTSTAKVEGFAVFNYSKYTWVYAAGNANADVWVYATGTTSNTPV